MGMLSILIIEEFEQYFNKMIFITEYISKEYYLLEEKTGEYINGLVHLSEKYHLPFASDIAIINAQIYTYSPEKQNNSKYERKLKKQYLLNCLSTAKSYVDNYFSKTQQLLEESSILLRKMAAVAVSKNLLQQQYDIDTIIYNMNKDTELMPALTNAIGTVGYLNMKILLERAITEVFI